ncbi:hypothetical protein RHMOL_Rhmol08G0238400 [Rhododendron molle]|uniref:Uncharacterized protein n=1 Tax=Rhododendron molle TaxID=49168 RepID=A0ACC0MRU3_RHOML|nr:hypothetical protein RHMOL_Rhmol08G0238400 [Rhododendron molle]
MCDSDESERCQSTRTPFTWEVEECRLLIDSAFSPLFVLLISALYGDRYRWHSSSSFLTLYGPTCNFLIIIDFCKGSSNCHQKVKSLCAAVASVLNIHFARTFRLHHNLPKIIGPLQYRSFQPDFVPRDPAAKPKRYKYPTFYDPYGPRPPPSDKIIQLAERIAVLPTEERAQIGPTLRERLRHPKMQQISVEGLDLGPQGGASTGSTKAEEKKVEKTAFDVKLEKFDASAKIKVIKEVRSFTSLGLKEAKDLVEKVPVLIKQGVTKEEANDIVEKIKAAGGVAVME